MADTTTPATKPKEEQVVEEDDEFEEFENDGKTFIQSVSLAFCTDRHEYCFNFSVSALQDGKKTRKMRRTSNNGRMIGMTKNLKTSSLNNYGTIFIFFKYFFFCMLIIYCSARSWKNILPSCSRNGTHCDETNKFNLFVCIGLGYYSALNPLLRLVPPKQKCPFCHYNVGQ